MSKEFFTPLLPNTAKVAADTRFNLGLSTELAQRDLIYANGYTGLVDFLNAFADGFNNTAGISSGDSSNYLTSEAGVVKPSTSASGYTSVYSTTLNTNTTGQTNTSRRNVYAASLLTDLAGSGLRVKVTPSTTGGSNTQIGEMFIGKKGGSAPNFDGGQVRVTFSGNNGVTLTGGGSSVTSDPVDFVYDGTSDMVIAYSCLSDGSRWNNASGGQVYLKSATTNESGNTTVSGYSGPATGVFTVDLIEAVTSRTPNSMDVRSVSRGINDTPTLVDIFALVEETDALTLNTDFFLHGSRDGNTSYVQGTAAKLGTLANGLSLIAATNISVTGQGAAKNLRWKITSANSKNFKVHAIAVYGRA